MQTIVIGHRNPDMDSICSAIAYARLKQLQGADDVIAARAGGTNARIDYVLQRFGFPSPMFLSDASHASPMSCSGTLFRFAPTRQFTTPFS